jgi:phosphoribosylanthranilate isomerase
VFVKVCGITNEEDALLAVAMGADAVGFIFAPSPRQVTARVVREITPRLPAEVVTFGVFVNEAPERVIEIVGETGLQAAQLHGGTAEQTRAVHARVPTVWKAYAAGDPGVRRAREHEADAIFVDNPRPGSGQVFDWSLAEDVPGGLKLVLAGGLTAANVGDAIRAVRPWGVDVGSGVEASPGRKDPRKVRAFVAAARAAAEELEEERQASTSPDGPMPYDWRDDG